MKPFILALTVSLLFLSCTAEQDQEIELKNQQIASLKTEIEQLKSTSVAEKKKHSEVILESNALLESIEKEYISKDVLESFLDKTYHMVFSKESVIRHFLYKELRIKEIDISTAIWESGIICKEEVDLEEYPITDKTGLLHYIWTTVDRSPESLSSLITEKEKRFIYSLFDNNNFYKKSGLEAMIKGLLLSYQEFENDEDALQELHQLLYSDEDLYEEVYELAEERLPTPEIMEILNDKNYSSYENYSSVENRVAYVYKFWARRHHEGNKEFVYGLLKEFHTNVSENP